MFCKFLKEKYQKLAKYYNEIRTSPNAYISLRKANYIKDLAAQVSSGQFKIDELNDLSDDELIAKLTEFKGVGYGLQKCL